MDMLEVASSGSGTLYGMNVGQVLPVQSSKE